MMPNPSKRFVHPCRKDTIFSRPICSYNSASRAASRFAGVGPSKIAWARSCSVRFQAWIWLLCTENWLDNSLTVFRSRTASNATFASYPDSCLFRFLPPSFPPENRSRALPDSILFDRQNSLFGAGPVSGVPFTTPVFLHPFGSVAVARCSRSCWRIATSDASL